MEHVGLRGSSCVGRSSCRRVTQGATASAEVSHRHLGECASDPPCTSRFTVASSTEISCRRTTPRVIRDAIVLDDGPSARIVRPIKSTTRPGSSTFKRRGDSRNSWTSNGDRLTGMLGIADRLARAERPVHGWIMSSRGRRHTKAKRVRGARNPPWFFLCGAELVSTCDARRNGERGGVAPPSQ